MAIDVLLVDSPFLALGEIIIHLSIMDNYDSWHKKAIAARENLDIMHWSDKRMARLTEKIYQEILTS